jgi:hypothetical protein
MNEHFGEQGYQTIGMGKIYHGHKGGPASDLSHWDRWIDVTTSEYALPENKLLVKQALQEKSKGSEHAPPEGPMTEEGRRARRNIYRRTTRFTCRRSIR